MNDYIGPIISYYLAGGNYRQGRKFVDYALPCGMRSRSSANFVGGACPGAGRGRRQPRRIIIYACGASNLPPRYALTVCATEGSTIKIGWYRGGN
ncbi:MAG: hypothetical protein CVU62_10870 [Deltaproteobacteria bacterium HGW-Deltaproteobacteria-2]|jgi:hypothetical protein|nr:MAG: hypothetical protein CVU62_10870 [Deltaproteobacteria bacterium HGW-Deltaproteobacteria-2]